MSYRWEDKSWQEEMRLRFDYTNCSIEHVGSHGLTGEEFSYLDSVAVTAHKNLISMRDSGTLGFMTLHDRHDDIDYVINLAEELKQEFESFVVVGIGGSALGNIALHTALNPPYYNELSKEQRKGGLKLYVPDNIDPDLINGLFNAIDPTKSVFNVITKSGSTSETMANFLVMRDKLYNQVGEENFRRHIVITTDPEKGFLRKLVNREGFRSLEVPQNVGGRFSVLSSVGLLSAAVTNCDIRELTAGAAYMAELCSISEIKKNPAYMSAGVQYLLYRKGFNISVMMPYVQALKDFADWYRQLWAESLGKKHDRSGKAINVGPTPVKALGATDQHSQVQLYAEGPYDKVITFLTVDKYNSEVIMPHSYGDESSLDYLGDRTLNELITAEQKATEYALTSGNRPNCTIRLPEINAFTIGQLVYMFELQTAFAGELFNVNAFDQPGVEAGKVATYALMNRKGYEKESDNLNNALSNQERYEV